MNKQSDAHGRSPASWAKALRKGAPFVVPGAVLLVIVVAIFRGSASVASADARLGAQTIAQTDGALALPDAAPGKGVHVSLAEVFFIQRHPATRKVEWLGSAIIWLLLGLSAASMALMAAFAWESREDAIAPPELLGRGRGLMMESRADEALELARARPSFLSEVLIAAISEADSGRDAMARAAMQASDERAVHRLRRIEPLNIIGNVAPMIGLFGTVYGMILAFREIVAAGGAPDPVGLAAGIGTALVTTFWGLVVAIPALAVYAVLRNRLDELTTLATRHAEDMINHFRDVRAGDAAGPGKRS